MVNGDEKGEWLEVGRVKSEGDEFTEVAVAMQRGLIAEHAKRLLPLQVKPKDMVEWGYRATNSDDEPSWSPVDKSVCDDAPKGVEKKIGFEGSPDPNSGFYCHYSSGRLVDKSDHQWQLCNTHPCSTQILRQAQRCKNIPGGRPSGEWRREGRVVGSRTRQI